MDVKTERIKTLSKSSALRYRRGMSCELCRTPRGQTPTTQRGSDTRSSPHIKTTEFRATHVPDESKKRLKQRRQSLEYITFWYKIKKNTRVDK